MEGYKQFVVKVFMAVLMAFLVFIGSTQGQPICCYRDPCCCNTCGGPHPSYIHPNWNLQKHVNVWVKQQMKYVSKVRITYEIFNFWLICFISLSLSLYIYIYVCVCVCVYQKLKDTYMIAWYKHETPQYQISTWLYNIHPCSHSKYATKSLS